MKKLFLALIFISILGYSASALIISAPTTWEGMKRFAEDILVTGADGILTIKPGTIVSFEVGGPYSLTVISGGALIASGTPEGIITFTSTRDVEIGGGGGASLDWYGILLYPGTSGSTKLSYCKVRYSSAGIRREASTGDPSISVSNSYFDYNGTTIYSISGPIVLKSSVITVEAVGDNAILCDGGNPCITIEGNVIDIYGGSNTGFCYVNTTDNSPIYPIDIKSNMIRIKGASTASSGIFAYTTPNAFSSLIDIENNIISVETGATFCYGLYIRNISPKRIKSNNVLSEGSGIGVYLENLPALSTIEGNTISHFSGTPPWGRGISCKTSSLLHIKTNIIKDNETGIYLDISSSSIEGNTITGNVPYTGIHCANNSAPCVLSNNISSNGIGVKCEGGSNPVIRGNSITGNNIGTYPTGGVGVLILDTSSPNLGTPEVGGNAIYGNWTGAAGKWDVYNNTSNAIDAYGNDWGTTLEADIELHNYDDSDPPGTSGPINFNGGYIQDPAPAQPTNLEGFSGEYQIYLRWNANSEADRSYYWVYKKQNKYASVDASAENNGKAGFVDLTPEAAGALYRVTCVDALGNESLLSTGVTPLIAPGGLPLTVNLDPTNAWYHSQVGEGNNQVWGNTWCTVACLHMNFDYYDSGLSGPDQTTQGAIQKVVNTDNTALVPPGPWVGTNRDDAMRGAHFSKLSNSVNVPPINGYSWRDLPNLLGFTGIDATQAQINALTNLTKPPYIELKQLLRDGFPLIVHTNPWFRPEGATTRETEYPEGTIIGHSRVLIGYDEGNSTFILHDPWWGPNVRFNQNFFIQNVWANGLLFASSWEVASSPQTVERGLGKKITVGAGVKYTAGSAAAPRCPGGC